MSGENKKCQIIFNKFPSLCELLHIKKHFAISGLLKLKRAVFSDDFASTKTEQHRSLSVPIKILSNL